MKLIKFFKENTKGFLVSGIIVSVGTLFLYAKQHQNSFDLSQFLMMLPFAWVLLFVLATSIGMFLFWRDN